MGESVLLVVTNGRADLADRASHVAAECPDLLSRAVLKCDDPDWQAWPVRTGRNVPNRTGNLPMPFLQNLQPASVFLPEDKAGEISANC